MQCFGAVSKTYTHKLRRKENGSFEEKSANQLEVKTIVTLALTLVFCILALCGAISSENFMTVFTVVIASVE